MRSLVPLDTQTILGSVAKTHRAFSVEENPRLCGWGAEIMSIIADEAFYDLDGPLVRITTPHMPLPCRRHAGRRHPADRRPHRRSGAEDVEQLAQAVITGLRRKARVPVIPLRKAVHA